MKVLVACEFSGVVREAFRARGHDALSCDLIPCEDGSPYHIQDDVLTVLKTAENWDMMIAFPPCTHLASSGARWFKNKEIEQADAIAFFLRLCHARIGRIAIENPVGIMSTAYRKPDQIIQPYHFGHAETKKTCLWLKNLPPLMSTSCLVKREPRVWKEPPSPDRWKNRSRTYQGIANAMAEQWGRL